MPIVFYMLMYDNLYTDLELTTDRMWGTYERQIVRHVFTMCMAGAVNSSNNNEKKPVLKSPSVASHSLFAIAATV